MLRKHTARARGRRLTGATLLLSCLSPLPAAASPEYPEALQEQLDMPCAATCVTCHRDAEGGAGTVSVHAGGSAFGQALMQEGLGGNDTEALGPAVQALAAEGSDSDRDGVTDVEELRSGLDPSQPGDAPVCGLEYGCQVGTAPGQPPWWLLVCTLLLVPVGRRSRWRRR